MVAYSQIKKAAGSNVPMPATPTQTLAAVPKSSTTAVAAAKVNPSAGAVPKASNVVTSVGARLTSNQPKAASSILGAIPKPSTGINLPQASSAIKSPATSTTQQNGPMDYYAALAQAQQQVNPSYQAAIQSAQSQGWQNNLDAGEMASARGGAQSGLAADLQNKVNINTSNTISNLEAQKAAQAAELAQSLVQRSEDNAYRNKVYDRGVFESDRSYNYGVSRDSVADSQWDKTFNQNADQQAWENRFNYGNAIGKFSNGQQTLASKDQAFSQNMQTQQFAYAKARDAISDKQWQATFDENVRQYGLNYALDKLSQENQQAYQQAQLALAQDDNSRQWAALDAQISSGNQPQTISATTAGQMLSQALQKQNGVDEDGKAVYGTYTDPATREKLFVDTWNASGVQSGADTLEMLVKAGYTTAEINEYKKKYPEAFNSGSTAGGGATPVSVKVPQQYATLINTNNRKYGLPDGLLAAIADAESDFNPNARNASGASGMFQFMPATAKGYGIDPYDPVQAADAAGKMMSGLIAKYDGDVAKALAGYNWGGGNVDKAINKYGDNWLAHAPAETQKYIKKILG